MCAAPSTTPNVSPEEKLRELCCFGDYKGVKELLFQGKVDINAQNKVNGWTALHWSAKRGIFNIVQCLLAHGADPTILNADRQLPIQLATDSNVFRLLGKHGPELSPIDDQGSGSSGANTSSLGFIPNYFNNIVVPNTNTHDSGFEDFLTRDLKKERIPDERPEIPHCVDLAKSNESLIRRVNGSLSKSPISSFDSEDPLTVSSSAGFKILKARIADSDDPDFIEFDLPYDQWTLIGLYETVLQELDCQADLKFWRIRKLPNTRLRRDIDVVRLKDYQELELCFSA